MDEAGPHGHLVVIGASAGGVGALSQLVASLPEGFPAPILIAQHLDPKRSSHLVEILDQRCPLPVRPVEHDQRLEAGVVHVVPPGRSVEFTDHRLTVRPARGGGSVPSIDHLLTTAARAFGEDLIAVILSGSGSDGTAGARQVKAAGGTVIIQDPETAQFPSMPQSLAPSSVDVTARVEPMGQLLYDLVTGAYLPARADQERALGNFLAQLRERSGIDFSSYKRSTIMRRLQRRMAATGSSSLRQYVRYVQRDPDEYRRLVSSFLIKVTEFFRDADLFQYLRERVLPDLIEQARQGNRELRFWSAGCATGEEAYSLAILIADLLGDELSQFSVRVFATDLDVDAVAFARRGVYPPSALSDVPPELRDRYFSHLDGNYTISKEIRALTIFGHHDLGQRAPFPRIDLALCRNVLIYFTTELQTRALQLLAFSLREGGYLVLGKAETTSPLAELFALEHPRLRVYRRHGGQVLLPPARIRSSAPGVAAPPHFAPEPRRIPAVDLGQHRDPRPQPRPAAGQTDWLLRHLPFGVVVVDARYDIQSINNAARRLLGIHGTAIGEDLIHLARFIDLEQLRSAIDGALRGDPDAQRSTITSNDPATGRAQHLQLSFERWTDAEAGDPLQVVILVTDITESVEQRRRLEQTIGEQQGQIERLAAQVSQLHLANRQLLEANQELATANAEQHAAYEELLVANEEIQAATEEVETLNEELQATNEELETLNEELQATVEELNTTNDDLEARSVELQELAAALDQQRSEAEAERARLSTILASIGDAVLVVDPEGKAVLSNPGFEQAFGDFEALALEDADGRPLSAEESPIQRAARGEQFTMEFCVPLPEGERCWYEAIGRPVSGGDGGVLVIRDITERSLRRLQEQFVAMASHELRTPLAAVITSLQLLQRRAGGREDPEESRLFGLAYEQTQRLKRLVDDLVDLARSGRGGIRLEQTSADLTPLVERSVELIRLLANGRPVVFTSVPGPFHAEFDPGRLEQVLLNLASNALAHAPESPRIEIRLDRDDDQALIEVQDFGPGIPPEELPRIFERFHRSSLPGRADSSGLGLGLYLAREIVTAHGGTISAASTTGQGTKFVVRLPLLAPPSLSERSDS